MYVPIYCQIRYTTIKDEDVAHVQSHGKSDEKQDFTFYVFFNMWVYE